MARAHNHDTACTDTKTQADFKAPPLRTVQGSLAHGKQPPPLGTPQDPRYSPTAGSQEGDVSYERGTPVGHHALDEDAHP